MEKKLIVSSSPHVRSNEDTSYIMKQVIIALMPAALAGVYFFRLNAISVMFFCILGTVGSEFLYQKKDGSWLKLRILKFKNYGENSHETLWIFTDSESEIQN